MNNLCGRRILSLAVAAFLMALVLSPAAGAASPTLGGLLDAGFAVKEAVGNVTDPLDAARRVILQLGHEMNVEVVYNPQDAPDGIHMRHDPDEPVTERRIAFKVSLEYKYDLQSELPAKDLRGLAGYDLPDKGPAKDVPVRFWFPKSILQYTELRADNWSGMLPTWWIYTDASGQATAYLYPLVDNPLGGVKKTAQADVRVQAMIQLKEGVPTGAIELGALLVEEVASPTEITVPVTIEYHEPTEWQGTVTVTREVLRNSKATSSGPKEVGDSRTILKSANELWTGTLEITDLRLNEDGVGTGKYHYSVTGEGEHNQTTKSRVECDSGIRVLDDKTALSISASSEEYGSEALVEIDVDPRGTPRYAVHVRAPGVGVESFGLRMSMQANQKRTMQTCERTIEQNGAIDFRPDSAVLSYLILPDIIWMRNWPQFDYDATHYSDMVEWEETKSNNEHTYVLKTIVEWDLSRVIKQ